MRKLLLLLLLFFGFNLLHSQRGTPSNIIETNLSPNGQLDNIFDQYGTKYKLSDILMTPEKSTKTGTVLTTSLLCTSGYFNLYFETNSGMESLTDPVQIERRSVVCKVFQDISNFINSPLTTSGKKVNIWVRNINQINPNSNGILGLATSFYNLPINATAGFGGIIDNEIWKTIHGGVDSYTNVTSPLISTGQNSSISGVFYHGMIAFNFNANNIPVINWNTNTGIITPSGLYDLYSVVLHEVTHALGFTSLINENGISKFGTGFNYFSRYDKFLKNNANTQFLLSNSSACSSMYNYNFNSLLNANILRPGCTISGNVNVGNSLDLTVCTNAIKYVGTTTIPVYSPVCFEPLSSLSHFEDQCYPPNINNGYFVMSNANGTGMTKRYLKTEERKVLCDVGYNVNTSFGNISTVSGTINYGGTACLGINVAGINDGINTNGTFAFFGIEGLNINISGILNNDYNTNSFECLQDVHDTTTTTTLNGLTSISGNSTTNIVFNSAITGLHLLRYVPINSLGQRGNITYVYVYVAETSNSCGSPNVCNLITNGDFEQYSLISNNGHTFINKACNWFSANLSGLPKYWNENSLSIYSDVPCNFTGYESDKIQTNKGYGSLGFVTNVDIPYLSETIKTKLNSNLLPNTNYELSFDVSLSEGCSSSAVKFQAYLSTIDAIYTGNGSVPITNPNMLFTEPSYSTVVTGWKTIAFNFKTGSIAGENTLYIGELSQILSIQNPPSPQGVNGCSYENFNYPANPADNGVSYYYIDNVKLNPLDVSINLPSAICINQTFANLTTFVSPILPSGVFSGTGISFNNGLYSFNPAIAGLGTKTISYSYTNILGCVIIIPIQIMVSDCSSTSCPGNLIFNSIETLISATYQAANSIITNTNYLVNPGSTITLKAGNSITFSPSSTVKVNSTSNFNAQITTCTQTSSRNSDQSEENTIVSNDDLSIFPNPTNGMLTIEMLNSKVARVIVSTLEGKLILNKNIEPTNFYQIDVTDYKNGMYILTVETNEGKYINKKVIKN